MPATGKRSRNSNGPNRDIIEFLGQFQCYVENLGSYSNMVGLVPPQIFQIIDRDCYCFAELFITEHGLEEYRKLPDMPGDVEGHQLREGIAFVFKNLWITGYLMHKLHEHGRIPPPDRACDPGEIDRKIATLPGEQNIGAFLPVFDQRIISYAINEGLIRQWLAPLGKTANDILCRHLDNLCGQARNICGCGALVSMIEDDVIEERKHGAGYLLTIETVVNSLESIEINKERLNQLDQSIRNNTDAIKQVSDKLSQIIEWNRHDTKFLSQMGALARDVAKEVPANLISGMIMSMLSIQ